MLCQFSFSNYKSFKNEAFLDFIAEPIRDHAASIITDKSDHEKFLPVIAIYGPNGGGKSTVLEALVYLAGFVLYTIGLTKMQSVSSFTPRDKYHKFDPLCKELPIRFDVMFRTKGRQYRYQLSILHNEVCEENLYMLVVGEKDASILFERSGADCILGEELEGIAVEKIKRTMPLLSHIAINYEIESINQVIEWFQSIRFVDYDQPQKDRLIVIPQTKDKKESMFQMLGEMDIPISGYRIEKDAEGHILDVYTKHTLENGKTVEILFEEESSGTRKLFSCLAEMMECLNEGAIMVADELDAKLHPKLLKYIIGLFTSPAINRHGAQLLLTSHDLTTMTPEVYRRDEIWFCARNPQNASKLYSLISFKKERGQPPRNDEAYGKQYLEGRYGADPYIRRILDWRNEDESETPKSR